MSSTAHPSGCHWRGIPNGDHALAMAAQRGQPLINLPDVAGNRVAQLVGGLGQFAGDVGEWQA
jgi:hypothetical protein